MDNIDIDDILNVIDGNTYEHDQFNSIQYRPPHIQSPVTRTTRLVSPINPVTDNVTPHNMSSRPTEPIRSRTIDPTNIVNAVGSSESESKEMISNMLEQLSKEVRSNLDTKHANTTKKSQPKTKDTQSVDSVSTIVDATQEQDTAQTQQGSHLTVLFGYSIPTSTIYFILILAAIAVVIYFLTSDSDKKDKRQPQYMPDRSRPARYDRPDRLPDRLPDRPDIHDRPDEDN